MGDSTIRVEVAAAMPDRQVVIELELPEGSTLLEAVERAGLDRALPEMTIDADRLGVFGKRRSPDTVLREGDRAEVYRPLTADPKTVRRQLAELARQSKG